MVAVFALASALIALGLKARIQRASGWSLWGLGALVPLCGHFLVSFGLSTGILVWDKSASESWAEVLIKSYVILPLVELMFTLMLMPIFIPLGALYVFILRAVSRASS